MDEQRLAEVEADHKPGTSGNCGGCNYDVDWPCDAVALVAEVRRLRESSLPERTPDGHAQMWLLYRPEPFAFDSIEDRQINLWVRRADVFTSRQEAIEHLDALLGRPVPWRLYDPIFPELWIGESHGQRWLMVPAPVNPPGGG